VGTGRDEDDVRDGVGDDDGGAGVEDGGAGVEEELGMGGGVDEELGTTRVDDEEIGGLPPSQAPKLERHPVPQ